MEIIGVAERLCFSFTLILRYLLPLLLLLLLSTMPHYPPKKQRIEGHQSAMVAGNDFSPSFDDLVDVLPNILGYLTLKDIMRKRRINKKTMEAVKMTIVPPADLSVNNMKTYNAVRVMTRALPNLQQLEIGDFCADNGDNLRRQYHKYNDGEDPNESQVALIAHRRTYDIEMISNFSNLRVLVIECAQCMNGRYPFLFNSFPLLQKLSIKCNYLKWDLEMLAGLPLLKELTCYGWSNECLTGNINSLGVLKGTLEKVMLEDCLSVEGNLIDLADFPYLKELNLDCTAVTGDIRDIGVNDFTSLERLILPLTVYGGKAYEMQRISDAPDLVRAVYLLKKQRPSLEMGYWYGALSSEATPNWYESLTWLDEDNEHPIRIQFVKAASRVGYQWKIGGGPCEVNWLDPEPQIGSSGYEKYIEELQEIQCHVQFYRGFHQPPTEDEYSRLLDELIQRRREEERYDREYFPSF